MAQLLCVITHLLLRINFKYFRREAHICCSRKQPSGPIHSHRRAFFYLVNLLISNKLFRWLTCESVQANQPVDVFSWPSPGPQLTLLARKWTGRRPRRGPLGVPDPYVEKPQSYWKVSVFTVEWNINPLTVYSFVGDVVDVEAFGAVRGANFVAVFQLLLRRARDTQHDQRANHTQHRQRLHLRRRHSSNEHEEKKVEWSSSDSAENSSTRSGEC